MKSHTIARSAATLLSFLLAVSPAPFALAEARTTAAGSAAVSATVTAKPVKTGTVAVKSGTLNVRSGPGTSYKRIGSLNKGVKVSIFSVKGDFYKILYKGAYGWVSKNYISSVKPVPTPTPKKTAVPTVSPAKTAAATATPRKTAVPTVSPAKTAASTAAPVKTAAPTASPAKTAVRKTGRVSTADGNLNVRSGPGTTYSRIGSLACGTLVTITGAKDDFYKIIFNGKTGYISKAYTVLVTESTPAPEKTPDAAVTPSATGTPFPKGTVGLVTGSGNTVKLYAAASDTSEVVGYAGTDSYVILNGKSGIYYRIAYNGGTAYILKANVKVCETRPSSTLSPTDPPKAVTVGIITKNSVKLRRTPSTDAAVVATVDSGTFVKLTSGNENGWYKGKFGARTCYIPAGSVCPQDKGITNTNLKVLGLALMPGKTAVYDSAVSGKTVIGYITAGTTVSVIGVAGKYLQIYFPELKTAAAYIPASKVVLTALGDGPSHSVKPTAEEEAAIAATLPATLSETTRTILTKALSCEDRSAYFWGGKYNRTGWSSAWGVPTVVAVQGGRTSGTIQRKGLDCSGFVQWCFRQAGVSIPSNTSSQIDCGGAVAWDKAKPGDLVFASINGDHVGIVVKNNRNGTLKVVQCSSSRMNVVVTTEEYGATFRYVRRVAGLD